MAIQIVGWRIIDSFLLTLILSWTGLVATRFTGTSADVGGSATIGSRERARSKAHDPKKISYRPSRSIGSSPTTTTTAILLSTP